MCCIPLNSTAGVCFIKRGSLTQFKYAHMRGENHSRVTKLKATFIAAKTENSFQEGGGNTNKRSKLRHWEARESLVIIYLLVSNVSCT